MGALSPSLIAQLIPTNAQSRAYAIRGCPSLVANTTASNRRISNSCLVFAVSTLSPQVVKLVRIFFQVK